MNEIVLSSKHVLIDVTTHIQVIEKESAPAKRIGKEGMKGGNGEHGFSGYLGVVLRSSHRQRVSVNVN